MPWHKIDPQQGDFKRLKKTGYYGYSWFIECSVLDIGSESCENTFCDSEEIAAVCMEHAIIYSHFEN